jgi:phage terminase large subunit-like protein
VIRTMPTTAEKIRSFIETHCMVPEGKLVGRPMRLEPFQWEFVKAIYDNPAGTSRAYLSIARKNGKSSLIAALALAHLVGPAVARTGMRNVNSQIISGARSRDQAALVYKLAEKMVFLNPELKKRIRRIPSQKTLIGIESNVEYKAIAAEAGTAYGLSPVVAILDEVGQVKGKVDPFIEAIETAQGAHDHPLLIAISTQSATDADLFSVWLDDAASSGDPKIVSRLYTAPEECGLMDEDAWRAANPALGVFRSLDDMRDFAERAVRMPASENTFRWLYLNQRIEASSPFVSKSVWAGCGDPVIESFKGKPVYAGLDLSETSDLTALVLIAAHEGKWHVRPVFWLPEEGLLERSRRDRVEYDLWAITCPGCANEKKRGCEHSEKSLATTPGRSIEYEYVAEHLRGLFDSLDMRQVAFDRWNWKHFRPWLMKANFSEIELERFVEFGQGYASMSPALRDLESDLLNGKFAHGMHPVLKMCAANAVVHQDPAGNLKPAKDKSTERIDGIVAIIMALGRAMVAQEEPQPEYSLFFCVREQGCRST